MKIQFTRNVQFTRLIKINGRLKEFNFRKANSKAEGQFTVDVLDDSQQGNRIIFKMEPTDNRWRIIQTDYLPLWILQQEPAFNELIDEELKRYKS